MNKDIRFYRVTRYITNQGSRLRLTEVFMTGYRIGGKEKITACYGRSVPYTPNTNTADHAA